MKNKWLAPRTRIFHKARARRRETAAGCGFSPTTAPLVRGYTLGASSPLAETSRRIVLRLTLFGALILNSILVVG